MGIATVGKFVVTTGLESKDAKTWFGRYRITCGGSHVDMKILGEPFEDRNAADDHALRAGVEHARRLPQE